MTTPMALSLGVGMNMCGHKRKKIAVSGRRGGNQMTFLFVDFFIGV